MEFPRNFGDQRGGGITQEGTVLVKGVIGNLRLQNKTDPKPGRNNMEKTGSGKYPIFGPNLCYQRLVTEKTLNNKGAPQFGNQRKTTNQNEIIRDPTL